MNYVQFTLFLITIIVSFFIYTFLRKKRFLFDDRFSMTIAVVASSSISFIVCFHLVLTIPNTLPVVMPISGIIGIIVGYFFGSFIKLQFAVVGSVTGFIASLMGAMVSGVLLNPSLCGLPWNIVDIQKNIMQLSLFSTFLFLMTMALLVHSFRA